MNRVRFAIAALVVLVAAAFAAGPASANHGIRPAWDPQDTNVPYLGWRGEELRLVKCDESINPGVADDPATREDESVPAGEGQLVDFIVEDWSGYPFQPPSLESSTVRFFRATGEQARDEQGNEIDMGCVKADFVSLKAGLAMIKLVVADAATGNPVMKHQFLAGWLSLNNPVIRELSATFQPGGGGDLGDPDGDGNFVAGGRPGRVQVEVTGELPLGNNFTELGLPATIQLPSEDEGAPDAGEGDTATYWDDLAAALATTSDARPLYRDAPWRMWDIHDDRTLRENHVNPVLCGDPATTHTTVDAVDDCDGDAFELGGTFSRLFGDQSAFPTIGPFDPLRPDETLLPDGKLDAGDVPMPAARIDIGIQPNTGEAGDISGVGFLSTAIKCEPYTRDNTCDPARQRGHNYYAPYYARYQPATAALSFPEGAPGEGEEPVRVLVDEASGNDGPSLGNNFPGYGVFSTFFGFYPYWGIDEDLRFAEGGDTECLEFLDFENLDEQGLPSQTFRQLPSGIQAATIFTDEHGEAQIRYHPGTGFFFDNLGARNLNPGCDLQDVDLLGFSDIQAIARYPYQKTTDPDKASNVIRKNVFSLFDKDVDCVPKGPIPPIENGLAFICTATAIDITGEPLEGEIVCFMTNGEGMREFPLGEDFFKDALHRLCVTTDEDGIAAVEVFGKCAAGNVIAEFLTEGGLIRFDTFTFACPPGGAGGTSAGGTSSGGSALPAGVDPASITPGVPTQQTQQVIQQAKADQAKPEGKRAAKPKKATLAFVRIDKKPFAKKSNRYVVVRVNAQARTARVQVTLIGKNGKVLGKVVRRVPTNRVVRVPNLKLPTAVKHARVKVLA